MSFERNSNKSEALDTKCSIVFLLKVICDASARLALVGIWIYTVNFGQFSTTMILGYYYGLMILLVLNNMCFLKDQSKIGNLSKTGHTIM